MYNERPITAHVKFLVDKKLLLIVAPKKITIEELELVSCGIKQIKLFRNIECVEELREIHRSLK